MHTLSSEHLVSVVTRWCFRAKKYSNRAHKPPRLPDYFKEMFVLHRVGVRCLFSCFVHVFNEKIYIFRDLSCHCQWFSFKIWIR